MKVLVVENDPTAADLVKTRLRNLGCQPLHAANAEEGLQLAITEQPTLVLLDLKLEDTISSGLGLLRDLRAHPETTHIPVFIHSIFVAHKTDVPEAQAMANGYLLKPFKFDDLKAIISGFLATQQSSQG
jgi:DNA-binding response OmpR family regulator